MRQINSAQKTHFYATVGAAIRREREAAGLGMTELARKAGLTQSAVHHAENGITCSLHVIAKLAHELDTTLDALVPTEALQ